jgi:hypothetical protein
MTRTQATALQQFLVRWLRAVIPTLQGVRIDRATGHVSARDSIGWRVVGTLADFASIARALGCI